VTVPTSPPAILGAHREALEGALRAAIGDEDDALVAAARYVMGWEDEHGAPTGETGKRIRPALCLAAAAALGGSIDDAMPGAVAVELVHNFSLVHDEIQDHDAERHHRPTLWARLGEAQAINVGDFLFTRSIQALTSVPGDASRRMRALQVLNAAIAAMIGGQWLDIEFERRERVSVADYLAMVAGKTGALLSAPLEIGAVLAGAEDAVAANIGRWGAYIGAAFQAQDDYLGIWGDPIHTGKSNTNDIARKKKTLPIVHALGDPDFGAVIARAYSRPELSAADIAQVVEALGHAGSAEYSREHARAQAATADALLATLPLDAETRAQFSAIGVYLVDRNA
jgi:geranylgeranyl diphosphate synthase type I